MIDDKTCFMSCQTMCGIKGVRRPCQMRGVVLDENIPYPHPPLCNAPNEAIYIVDDNHVFLEETSESLKWLNLPVFCFDDPSKFQVSVSSEISGCVLLDLQLPGCDGASVLKWLRSGNCSASIIFISGTGDIPTAVDCMKAGAKEFLVKPINPNHLRHVVGAAIAESRMEYCKNQSLKEVGIALGSLTTAEHAVADLLAQGFMSKQIAGILGRSENTIKIHRARIMAKMGVVSTTSLAQLINLFDERNNKIVSAA